MKKILFALCAILMATVHANAQTSIIATLSHEGNISAYYGSNALIQAYEASTDGDVISLSPGLFNSVNIGKAITLRGSGCDNDPATGRQATYLSGNFTLTKSEGSEEPIVIEGIYNNNSLTCSGDGVKVQILKSRLNNLTSTYNSSDANQQWTIINCRITGILFPYYSSNATCINSIIQYPSLLSGASIDFRNCYVSLSNLSNCVFNNCIINYNSYMNSNNIVNNCIGSGDKDLFKYVQGGNNTYIDDLSAIFESYNENVDDVATYELTADAKTKYVGNDGTEVGIYGGMMPFSTTPSSPQITKFKVAEKSTADGKLSIDITISMPE